jgi:hypothetical protein
MATEEIVIIRNVCDNIYPIIESSPQTVAFMSQADKDKLNALSVSGDYNVQPDWDETNTESWAYIKNKPTEELNLLSAHIDDKNNPHEVELNQLKDVILNEVKTGDMLIYQEMNNKWNNTNQINITDGGNF